MMFNHWSSLLLTFVLLIGIGICFKRLDYLVMDEIKALVSILFGFATSCLFLSFIWLIQRRPVASNFYNNMVAENGAPNMNPRGSMNNMEQQTHFTISTITTLKNDKPPNYEDALINSKPVDCYYLDKLPAHHSTKMVCTCASLKQAAINSNESRCSFCLYKDRISKTMPKSDPVDATLTALSNNAKDHTAIDMNQATGSRRGIDHDMMRKISLEQLDANQLLLSQSPPKYSEVEQQLKSEFEHSRFKP